jgi:hypothetical protein
MFKSLLKSAAAPLALCCVLAAPTVAAKAAPLPVMMLANPSMGGADAAQGEAALMEIFAKLFDTGDKTPIDPAQLELGRATSAKLLPDGAYGKMMEQMLGQFLKPILAMDPGLSGSAIAAKTGMDYEAADKLTEDQRKAIAAIIDPQREARTEGALALMTPLMLEAGKALEPPMREGIARAYARKFSAAQLNEINAFFATPIGSSFAAESFAIQGDPEVLSATMQAMPLLLTKVMGSVGDLEAKMKALPQERKISELSAADLAQLAKLTDTTPEALKEHDQMMAEMSAAAEAAADAAAATGDAADAAIATAEAASDGGDPWYMRENWSPEDVAKVEELERQQGEIMGTLIDAEQAAIERAKARLTKKK